jgi:uncharacterized protein YyaL (SSP411 family)
MTPGASLAWLDWSTEAFAAAHRGSRPVLLLVGTTWSDASRRLEQVLADTASLGSVTSRFVAVRVDADRRPDIAARYSLGDWPTLACLTPDGEVLSGGTAIEASRLAMVLTKVADTFEAEHEDLERRAREGRRARREASARSSGAGEGPDTEAPGRVAAWLKQAFDPEWAGFGDGPKTPETAAVAFALTHGVRTGDQGLREIAVRTLDRLGWSDLSDAPTGAFHRACGTRTWGEPDPARLLGVQADLAGLFLDAAVILDEEAYAERARAAIAFVVEHLADSAGGFFESERDRILVTSSNARMVRTLLRAAEVLRAPQHGELALATIERLVPLVYASSAGVAHYLESGSGPPAPGSRETARGASADDPPPVPRVRGLLVDQVDTSAALIDLTQASGNRVYLELAEELMRSCLRKLWRAEAGGFLDRLRSASGGGDIGRMADPLVPFATNCHAARVLATLARETGHDELRLRAVDTLAALAPSVDDQGLAAADYALAVIDVTAGVEA